MLILMAVLSLAIGNITAIAQTNLKRMLAYSTIWHMGFLLLGILAGDLIGYSAGMFYVVVYVLMNLGLVRHDPAAFARAASRPRTSTTSRG